MQRMRCPESRQGSAIQEGIRMDLVIHAAQVQPMSDDALIVPVDGYFVQRSAQFPTYASLQWFIRVNRDELFEAGALVRHRGRLHVNPTRFDSEVVKLAKQASKRAA